MDRRHDKFTNKHGKLAGTCGIFLVLLTQLNAQVTVEMSQYNYERTGANLQEWILHPSNVNAASFGKLFSRNVDASVYALPLIVPKE